MKRVWFIFLLLALLAFTGLASAHADLARSTPQPGEHLGRAPSQVDLYFSEAVEAGLSDIAVFDSAGARVDRGGVQAVPGDPAHLIAALGTMKDGYYTVSWRVMSADDGHITGGSFSFAVGQVEGPAPAGSGSGSAPVYPAQAAVKGLLYAAAAVVVGGLIYRDRQYIVYSVQYSELHRLMAMGVALAGLATLAGVAVQAAIASPGPAAGPIAGQLLQVLEGSRYGVLALARLALLLHLAGLLFFPRTLLARWAALAVSLLFLLTISLESHAAAQQSAWLPVGMDLLHLLAASVWTGGLACLLVDLWGLRRTAEADRLPRIACLLERFSPLAFASAAILALTGLYAAVLDVGSIGRLFGTPYGQALAAKLGLVMALLSLGGYNHFVQRRRIQASGQAGQDRSSLLNSLRRSVTLEAFTGAALLLWVGVFTSLPPANPAFNNRQLVRLAEQGELSLRLVVAPGKVGFNRYDLQVDSLTGHPAGTSGAELLFFSSNDRLAPAEVRLEPVVRDQYTVQGPYLAYPDRWQIRTIVERPDRLNTVADFYIDLRPGLSIPVQVWARIMEVAIGIGFVFLIIRRRHVTARID